MEQPGVSGTVIILFADLVGSTELLSAIGDEAAEDARRLQAGEPIRTEGDQFGTPVVVASRLCDSADSGDASGAIALGAHGFDQGRSVEGLHCREALSYPDGVPDSTSTDEVDGCVRFARVLHPDEAT